MIIGSLWQEAMEATGPEPVDGKWFGFLHECVDGSHQWCREWESDWHDTRLGAALETYQALLNALANDLVTDAYYAQMAQEVV